MENALGSIVELLVSHAALDHIEAPTIGGSDYLARFEKHRGRFDQAANDKYALGKIENDGSVALLLGDL